MPPVAAARSWLALVASVDAFKLNTVEPAFKPDNVFHVFPSLSGQAERTSLPVAIGKSRARAPVDLAPQEHRSTYNH